MVTGPFGYILVSKVRHISEKYIRCMFGLDASMAIFNAPRPLRSLPPILPSLAKKIYLKDHLYDVTGSLV